MPSTKEVHRPLALVSPRPKGDDVLALQRNTNQLFDHYKIEREVEVDGVLGVQTFEAAREIARAHGAVGDAQEKLERRLISEGVQKLIRGRTRSADEVAAAHRREDYRKQLRARFALDAGERAIRRSDHLVGITERPPESNLGPHITEMEQFTGYAVPAGDPPHGVFWCGCAACWIVVKLGGAQIPDHSRLGFAPYITADALNHDNGFTAVKIQKGRAGDIVCLWGGEHIVTLRKDVELGDTVLHTREGNTSPPSGSGSQSNGGGLWDRERPIGDADRGIAARPAWA